jgi:hypothetical protein
MGGFISKAKDSAFSFMKGGLFGWLGDNVEWAPLKMAWLVASDLWLWAAVGAGALMLVLLPEFSAFSSGLPASFAVWILPGIMTGLWWTSAALKTAEETWNI